MLPKKCWPFWRSMCDQREAPGGRSDPGRLLPVAERARVLPANAGRTLAGYFTGRGQKTVAIDQIQQQVAEHFGIRPADMTAKGRRTNIVFPRQVAMYLARRHTKASLHEIGENFGGRHHGTVLHACKTVSARMKNEDQFRQTIAGLDTKLDR
jgi:chromosomal replication initiator protein